MSDEIVPVIENRPLTGGHFLLRLHSPRQAQATRPGQFAMLRMLGRTDVLLRRPMSIYDIQPGAGEIHGQNRTGGDYPARTGRREQARNGTRKTVGKPPKPEVIELLYKVVGRGTRLMSELNRGDKVGLLAPLGHGFFEEEYLEQAREADQVLHVAGGIGIAALLMPARALATVARQQRLFFGGRTKHDLVGVADFGPYVRSAILATEDGSHGRQGYVTRPLEEYLARHKDRRFLLLACGPWAMLRASADLANRYGHPCLVSMENRMGCALGVCLGCSIRVHGEGHGAYERVCTEGPVFRAEHVVWDKDDLPKT